MSKGFAFIALFVAILCGVVASFAVIRYIQEVQSTPGAAVVTGQAEPADLQNIILIQKEIPIGTKIKAEDIVLAGRPKDLVPAGAVTSVSDAVGKEAQSTLYPGEMLILFRLSQDNASLSLTGYIPNGYRAITLQVDDSSGVAGFIQPGHFVDVIATFEPQGGAGGQTLAKVILQNVKVLAKGEQLASSAQKTGRTTPNVTLMVTPAQAEQLTLADSTGQVRLVLRNPEDQDNVSTDGANIAAMFGGKEELPAPVEVIEAVPTPVPSRKVEVLRGTDRSEQSFPVLQ